MQQQITQEQKKLLDIKQAAIYMGISTIFLRKELKAGRISFYEGIGKGYKFNVADLDSWIESKHKEQKSVIDN